MAKKRAKAPDMNAFKMFSSLKRRNKLAFTFIVGFAIILFWKGAWSVADIIFDEWIFRGHLFWSNIVALIVGFGILFAAGLVLEKLA